MKDIKYFLDTEKEFQKNHPNVHEQYYDSECGCMMPKSYPEDFLKEGWMNIFAQGPHSEEVKDAIRKYNLSETEVLIMNCFYGNLSQYFRDDTYTQFGGVPEVAKEMQKVLTSFIKKAPKHNGGVLYRFLKSHDNTNLKIGDIFEPTYSLTTTNEDWEQDKDVYVITPLLEEKTSAFDIYKIYNHNEEKQVNFLKGTKFRVTNVERDLKGFRRIYMDEI